MWSWAKNVSTVEYIMWNNLIWNIRDMEYEYALPSSGDCNIPLNSLPEYGIRI